MSDVVEDLGSQLVKERWRLAVKLAYWFLQGAPHWRH